MIADNTCERELALEIFEMIRGDLCSEAHEPFERVYTTMIYNAAFGDIDEAERAAKQLSSLLGHRSDVREGCFARAHVAEVLVQAGHVEQSRTLLQEAYHLAVANSLGGLACLAGRRLAWLCLNCGDYLAAGEWVRAVLPLSERIQHLASRADVLGAAAELALHAGRTDEASTLLRESEAAWRIRRHARSEAFSLSTQVAIWLADGNRDACRAVLPRFLELYGTVRRHTEQDQTVARLVTALEYAGDFERADEVLREYLWVDRRGRDRLSSELDAVCKRRRLAPPDDLQTQSNSFTPPPPDGLVS